MIDLYRAKTPRSSGTDHPNKHNYLLTDLNIFKLPRLPARLTTEETAFFLRIEKQDLPWIVQAGFLVPCGRPSETAQKWYSTVEVLGLAENPEKLSEMTEVISDRWANKNARRKKGAESVRKANVECHEGPKAGGH